jgi:hypothetical protein
MRRIIELRAIGKCVFVLSIVTLLAVTPCFAQLSKIWDKLRATDAVKSGQTKIADGLKEALRVGVNNAVAMLGKTDGYLSNEALKIRLPEQLKGLENALRSLGLGQTVDNFVLSMNRAAEAAAPLAKDVFLDALTGMSFEDAKKVLNGGDTAATDYFKQKTYDTLLKKFSPVIAGTLQQNNVVQKYSQIVDKVKTLPFTQNFKAPNIENYVMGKSLDGLFAVLASEERKIRKDPAARVTSLLKEVFK